MGNFSNKHGSCSIWKHLAWGIYDLNGRRPPPRKDQEYLVILLKSSCPLFTQSLWWWNMRELHCSVWKNEKHGLWVTRGVTFVLCVKLPLFPCIFSNYFPVNHCIIFIISTSRIILSNLRVKWLLADLLQLAHNILQCWFPSFSNFPPHQAQRSELTAAQALIMLLIERRDSASSPTMTV